MSNLEQMKSTAVNELAKQGFRYVEFINWEYFNGQPEQPFLLPQPPHFVLRFRNRDSASDSTIEDGDSLLCVRIDDRSLEGSLISAF
jgi:hypothetical protein